MWFSIFFLFNTYIHNVIHINVVFICSIIFISYESISHISSLVSLTRTVKLKKKILQFVGKTTSEKKRLFCYEKISYVVLNNAKSFQIVITLKLNSTGKFCDKRKLHKPELFSKTSNGKVKK